MKKILIFCLFSTVLFSLIACNKPKEQRGEFYTLQEAYDNNIISIEDLRNIAYYHNESAYPDELYSLIEKVIIETRVSELKAYYPEATIEDVFVLHYYGKYDDGYAVTIGDNFTLHGLSIESETIEGITIYGGSRTLIWLRS